MPCRETLFPWTKFRRNIVCANISNNYLKHKFNVCFRLKNNPTAYMGLRYELQMDATLDIVDQERIRWVQNGDKFQVVSLPTDIFLFNNLKTCAFFDWLKITPNDCSAFHSVVCQSGELKQTEIYDCQLIHYCGTSKLCS